MQTVSLSLFRFDGIAARLWVLAQMGAARIAFARMPDVGFWKLCGSGTGEGFRPKPNWGVWAILAAWPDEATARRNVGEAGVYKRWRKRARESWTVYLDPISVRGQWSGKAPFLAELAPEGDERSLAVLTRASLKPSKILRFWNRVPDISSVIGADPNVMFKIGIGELPLLHQVTFSIWPDAGSMAKFARGDGPHGRAICAVREGDWFAEELYARFAVTGSDGQWGGRDPLTKSLNPLNFQPKDAA
ncbi:MAG: spheroidene monooxygenase [Rhodoferax sp.]|nr:spheroidene monooxygenase [Pseudorhodobacter sp.]